MRCGTACRWALSNDRPRAFLWSGPLPDVCVAWGLRACVGALKPRTDQCAWAWTFACIRRGAGCTGGGGGGLQRLRVCPCAGTSARVWELWRRQDGPSLGAPRFGPRTRTGRGSPLNLLSLPLLGLGTRPWCTSPAVRLLEPVTLSVCIYRSGPVLATQG